MKQSARLIIPVWGERYVEKVLSITLPAVLAAGNLPTLCRNFDVELVIVTETRLFDEIRRAPAYQAVGRICVTKLAALDDLLTDLASDYGIVLTYALFRGFSDLGPRMTETYLLFLNADFIICDGALGHLGVLMQKGKRVIHAPSFRVVAEDVLPQLSAAADGVSNTLALPAREMVRLALTHKHLTVKARTVNQRLYYQSWMDQFYWYVDEDTLIGYQAPVALVAIKPERVVTEPVLVWDFGFLPEAAPTAQRYFITDSDDFFMIEPQSRDTGREMIRIGWTTSEQVARDLSMWLTKEQRESCKQLLTIHASDLPSDIDEVITQARSYMAEVERRLSPMPASHVDHPFLGRWFEGAKVRRRASQDAAQQAASGKAPTASRPVAPTHKGLWLAIEALRLLQMAYCRVFGSPPEVGKFHPLWSDITPTRHRIAEWEEKGENNILRVKVDDWGRAREAGAERSFFQASAYDACICELTVHELFDLRRLYAELRPLIKNGGHIIFKAVNPTNRFARTEFFLNSCDFPDSDFSEIHFDGTPATSFLRSLYIRALRPASTRLLVRGLAVCALFVLAPFVRLVNAWSARRDSTIFRPTWTSLTIEFTVRRGPVPANEARPQISAASA